MPPPAFTAVAPDLRGYGHTDTPADVAGYSLRENLPGLRKVVVMPGCGHRTQQERPHDVTNNPVSFLRSEYAHT